MADRRRAKIEGEIAESVFPLPLTPIEKFFLWDERPGWPLTSFFELNFNSSLDVGLLEKCIAKVIERNPLLRATIVGNGHDLRWVLSDKPFSLLSLQDEPPVMDGSVRPINLRKEHGCRFWCDTREGCSQIIAQLHHSVCDGIAFRNICIDILQLYAAGTHDQPQAMQERRLFCERVEYSQLGDRFHFGHLGKPKRETTTWQRIKNAWYFHFQPPTPLIKDKSRDTDPKSQSLAASQDVSASPLCNVVFNRDFSERVLRACREKGLGVNQLAMAMLFRTCYLWNRKRGDRRKNGRLRILMPVDLRGREDVRMPAANRLSLSFLGRNYSQCDDLDRLIDSVQAELQEVKDTHLYLDLLKGIQFGCQWPRFMRWALARHKSMATAALTYTGDLARGMTRLFPGVDDHLRVGNALLSSTMGAPPVRQNTNISMAVCINWGQICIAAMWDRTVFSKRDCQDFLELYKLGWYQWCEAEESLSSRYAGQETVQQERIGPS